MSKGTRRRQKGYATEPEEGESVDTLLDVAPGPTLPAVPIASSWNYGATLGTGLPSKIALQPTLDADRMAQRINAGLDMAEKRSASPPSREITNGNLEPWGTRFRRTAVKNQAPVPRRTKRHPTPDQTQLMRSLHDATHSPPASDASLSPPIAQTVSTDSSPSVNPPLPRRLSEWTDDTLYPSPLKRRGEQPQHTIPRRTPDRESSIDNASEVSWNLERDIHEDELQRTRPSKYRGERHGRNITKPPRRPSGLSMIQDTIHEEEDEEPEIVLSHSGEEPEDQDENAPAGSPEEWDAPARTIIPRDFHSRAVSESSDPDGPRSDNLIDQMWPSAKSSHQSGKASNSRLTRRRLNFLRAILLLLIPLGAFFIFSYHSEFFQNLQSEVSQMRWCLPFGRSPMDWSSNATDSAAFRGLQSQVTRIDSQMSSLSRELSSLRSEISQSPKTTSIVHPGQLPKPVPRINFLSPGMGALIDPTQEKTSPSAGKSLKLYQKLALRIPYLKETVDYQPPPAPITALMPWEDVGDCWCSTPRNGVSQLSVALNRPIVPEEIVVEHIPFTATPEPYAAPKDIEIWARYGVFPSSSPKVEKLPPPSWWKIGSTWNEKLLDAKELRPEGAEMGNPVTEETLPLVVMSTLRIANKGVPEHEYSDDPQLGPGYYRIGKVRYDIYDANNIQRFPVDGTIEISHLRVDHITFRMTSNWGSNRTCVYRFKLHGHE